MLTVYPITAFDDNYIWLIGNQQHSQVAIVDPGDGERVVAYCQSHGLIPAAILITHHHSDHTGGIAAITQHYEIPVYGPARENIRGVTHPLKGGEQITISEIEAKFQVIDTPGHTAGHVIYYGHQLLFCGDTLFAGGCGRLFEGSAAQMQHAMETIRALPEKTLIYCAHEYTLANLAFARVAEPKNDAITQRQQQVQQLRAEKKATVPSLLSVEKQTNPFLRWDNPALIKAASNYSKSVLSNPVDVFATVRKWKDDLD